MVSEEDVVALARARFRQSEIAARLGFTTSAVQKRIRALRRRGLLPPGRNRVTRADLQQLLALRRAGLWPSEIAARTGLTADAVTSRLQRLRRSGVDLSRPAGPVPRPGRRASDGEILPLARQGLRHKEIAARLGLSRPGLQWRIGALRRRGLLSYPPADGTRPHSQKVSDGKLVALVKAGLRREEIARRVGISRSAVQWRLRGLRRRGLLPPAGAAAAGGSPPAGN